MEEIKQQYTTASAESSELAERRRDIGCKYDVLLDKINKMKRLNAESAELEGEISKIEESILDNYEYLDISTARGPETSVGLWALKGDPSIVENEDIIVNRYPQLLSCNTHIRCMLKSGRCESVADFAAVRDNGHMWAPRLKELNQEASRITEKEKDDASETKFVIGSAVFALTITLILAMNVATNYSTQWMERNAQK